VRIAFVGLPIAALLLARDGHEIVWAGVCRRDAIGIRRLRRMIGKENVAIVPDLTRVHERIAERHPDLLVSWYWTKKVPANVRAAAVHGGIGVHPSLLPRHRGPDPTFWAIDSGDEETGVTAHVLEDEYDTGAILAQRALAIDPSWNAWTLAKKLDRPSLALLREVVRDIHAFPARHQDDAKATPAPAPTDDDLELRWSSWTAERIERRVRAAAPWPGAFTSIGDETIVLTRVRVTDDFPKALEPGELAVRKDGVAVIRCVDRAVELREGRLEDDENEEKLDAEALADVVGGSLREA
jgi:methionyl-tRNA formyltransferase